MFNSDKQPLDTLLQWAHEGKLQLPDFQRSYVWTEDGVVSLLGSILRGYPVGALLTLERGGEVDFKPRGLEGTNVQGIQPATLLLDGQQRLTSLYQALYSVEPALMNRGRGSYAKRYFFLDIVRALNDAVDIEDAIIAVPEDLIVRSDFGRKIDLDLSTDERQFEQRFFPLNRAFNDRDWIFGWRGHWRNRPERDAADEIERGLETRILRRLRQYQMPIINLDKTNSRAAICTIFEKVNVGGVKLDAFELLTAMYAGEGAGYDLRKDWFGSATEYGRRARISQKSPSNGGIFVNLQSTDFLQACALLHTIERRDAAAAAGKTGLDLPQVSCKRETLLGLPLDAFHRLAPKVEQGFSEAAKFLGEQRILYNDALPYAPQIMALAAYFALMGTHGNTAIAKAKLVRWFWAGVLGEHYGSGTDTKIARDIPELRRWTLDQQSPEPQIFSMIYMQPDRLNSLRNRRSALYKGFHALLMKQGCRDFVTSDGFDVMSLWQDPIDVHHIFPEAWCKEHGKMPEDYNSIINKTPLSAATNRGVLRGEAPSKYLARIEQEHGIAKHALDELLRQHLIDPALLRADDFEKFFVDRKARLASLAGKIMGRPVINELAAEPDIVPAPPLSRSEYEELNSNS
jgi:hypothetical protein